jgi:hypothetical protein
VLELAGKEKTEQEPNIAVGIEMDELEENATQEEIEKGDYTEVTKLVRDRITEE